MSRNYFNNPRTDCVAEGLLAISEYINSSMLKEAYSNGIFPWPQYEGEVLWFCPDKRGVLFFKDLKINKSLQKAKKKSNFTFTINTVFEQVISECAKQPRAGEVGTWITEQMLQAYKEFYTEGFVLSVECWQDDELVGGVYGILINGVYSGESMFFKKDNASKLALLYLIDYLKAQGLTWMDIQMVTPVTESLGGKEIPRNTYLDLLEPSVAKK